MFRRWKKCAAIAFLAFIALWTAGTIRGLALPFPPPPPLPLAFSEYSSSPGLPSANNLAQIGLSRTPLPLVLDQPEVDRIQVYEKLAQLTVGTAAFDDCESRCRAALTTHQATVFHERSAGIAPGRRLTLEIGVHPEQFDALVDQLRQVAHLESISVQRRDRTGEFRRLHAQRQSLKKYLETIEKLRGRNNTSIDDTLKLEQKIQDTEKELQTFSGQLGDLLGKESFYHVYLSLSEYQPGSALDHAYTLPQRLAHALLWALAWWVAVIVVLGVLVATFVSIRTLAKRT